MSNVFYFYLGMKMDFSAIEQVEKGLAILIDPDFGGPAHWERMVAITKRSSAQLIFIGGSFLHKAELERCIEIMRQAELPIILFPGSSQQVVDSADAILLLSLISGRNPEFLIGQHVQAARALKKSGLLILPTGYLLIDGGKPTTASYISNTQPLPADKPQLAAATALAGELLGMKLIYLDAGSGANYPVSMDVIASVRKEVNCPIIVGGGIKSQEQAEQAWMAGANWVVMGNIFEEDPSVLENWK